MGSGTGLLEKKGQVLHKTESNIGEVYREILVDNPLAILSKNARKSLTESEAIITIGN